jgi:hypothetical protein
MFRTTFYASIALAFITALTFVIAFLTPPLSGPFCLEGCYEYPYHDIASRFPRDYYWMYPAILATMVYMIFFALVHVLTPKDYKGYSLIGFGFAVIASTILILDYFIQLFVIQPSLLNGEFEGIALWSQYNPHGLFIVLEEAGYFLISVSFLFTGLSFKEKIKSAKVIRYTMITGFILSIISFVVINSMFGIHREYRYEVAIISIDWLVLIIVGIAATVFYKHATPNI